MRSSAFKNEDEFQNIELLDICEAVLKFIPENWAYETYNTLLLDPVFLPHVVWIAGVPRNLLEIYLAHPPYWGLLRSILSERSLGWPEPAVDELKFQMSFLQKGRADNCFSKNIPDLLFIFTPSSSCSSASQLTSLSAVVICFSCSGIGASGKDEKLHDWTEKALRFLHVLCLISLPVAVVWNIDTSTPSPAQLQWCWMYSILLKEIIFFLSLPWGQKSFCGPFNYCRLLWLKFPL